MFVALAFRTRDSPTEMLFLPLSSTVPFGANPPFTLRIATSAVMDGAPAHLNDLALCVQLALGASDWVIHRLVLGDIAEDPADFNIVDSVSFDSKLLQQEARAAKEKQMALRALKLMDRLAKGAKRKRQPQAQQPPRRGLRPAMPVDAEASLSDSGAAEFSDWAGSAGEEDQEPWAVPNLDVEASDGWFCSLFLHRNSTAPSSTSAAASWHPMGALLALPHCSQDWPDGVGRDLRHAPQPR